MPTGDAVDGAIQADAKVDKAASFLVTKKPYTDFRIRAEFWVSDDANTGIYMRCADVKNITDRTCYEANVFDQRPEPIYGTGAIVHISPVSPMPKAGGKWNTYDITVQGQHLTVHVKWSGDRARAGQQARQRADRAAVRRRRRQVSKGADRSNCSFAARLSTAARRSSRWPVPPPSHIVCRP